MSVVINSRTFDDNLNLIGYAGRALRAGSVRYLSGGGCVDQSVAVDSGQQVTISADLNSGKAYGLFSAADRDYLNDLRSAGSTVAVNHYGTVFQARVMAVDLEPLLGEVDPDAESVFIGPVTLLVK